MPPEQFRQHMPGAGKEPEPQQSASGELPRIRTYQSDVEEMMQRQHVSKATIALAEDERSRQEAGEAAPREKVFGAGSAFPIKAGWNSRLTVLVSGVAVVIVVGIGVGAYFFLRTPPPATTTPAAQEKPKAAHTVALQGKETRAGTIALLQKNIAALSVPQNELRVIPVTVGERALTTQTFFTLLQASTPSSLARSLGTAPALGLHGFKGGQPFLLWSVSSYDNAFPAMLSFEETVLDDIGPLFGVHTRELLAKVGDTTADAIQNRIVFKDVIIRNKDVRAAFGPQGTIVFLYAFIDKQTLVLTTNEETLKTLIVKAGGGRLR